MWTVLCEDYLSSHNTVHIVLAPFPGFCLTKCRCISQAAARLKVVVGEEDQGSGAVHPSVPSINDGGRRDGGLSLSVPAEPPPKRLAM